MDPHPLHQDNAAAWNVTAAKYEHAEQEELAFLRAGGSSLLAPEQAVLGDLSGCRLAIHLQCAGGLDTLSLLRHGAQRVHGVDISERMIASARRKSQALGAPAGWTCCDVLDTPEALWGTADLVHTGRGALPWTLDLDAWAALAARLLRPGGRLHIFEGHPLDWVWDAGAADYRFDPARGHYFTEALGQGQVWPRPFINRQAEVDPAAIQIHDHQWTLGQVINAVLRAGLRLTYFNEYPQPFWNQFPNMPEDVLHRLPHTFQLVAIKE
jgi:SAM-dependent methyltransferase